MKQRRFIELHEAEWDEIDRLLAHHANPRKNPLKDNEALERFPALYRRLCQHYAVARQRHYSPHLVNQLHQLMIRGHNRLYSVRIGWWRNSSRLLTIRFPRMLRDNALQFWLACALFYLPGVLAGLLCYFNGDLIYSIMPEASVAQMEAMYDPNGDNPWREAGRESDTDFQMFGFYIKNNISIGFSTFASGLLLGIGSIFKLFYNGLVIGSVAGHLTQLGFTSTFWPFVSGHSALELTAIVICGTAGLMLARGIYRPGRDSRTEALKREGRDAIVLVIGAATMLLLAAFVEAFWSSSSVIPAALKYLVSALLWLLVIAFLSQAGRR
jgi:uncharacterized membrane protein SpoIIM required for sporulation